MIEIGQVIWLKIRFNKSGVIADKEHPLLVVDIDKENNVIEVAHLDHVDEDNYYHALLRYNHLIENSNPPETVIFQNSYMQMNNVFKLDNIPELIKKRRTTDKLSKEKLNIALSKYKNYQLNNYIQDERIVYMDREEIISINPDLIEQ